jgi:hypothetical protein
MDQRFVKHIPSFFILIRNNLIISRANALGGLVKEAAASMFSANSGPKTSEHAEVSLKA